MGKQNIGDCPAVGSWGVYLENKNSISAAGTAATSSKERRDSTIISDVESGKITFHMSDRDQENFEL